MPWMFTIQTVLTSLSPGENYICLISEIMHNTNKNLHKNRHKWGHKITKPYDGHKDPCLQSEIHIVLAELSIFHLVAYVNTVMAQCLTPNKLLWDIPMIKLMANISIHLQKLQS